jgi:methionine aminopeptidase
MKKNANTRRVPGKDTKDVKVETTTAVLQTALEEPEKDAKAREIVEFLEKIAELEAAKKEATDGFKNKIDEQEVNILAARKAIRWGVDKEVEVEIRSNYKEGIIQFVRMDTGEIYNTNPMTAEQRQEFLDLEGGDSEKGKAA